MIAAEKLAGRKQRTGKYDWSPALEKVGRTVTFWKLKLHQTRQGYVNPERIERLQKELKIRGNITRKDVIKRKLKEAWRNLKEVQFQHRRFREEHLACLAEFYANQRETTKEQELKQLIHIEGVVGHTRGGSTKL